MLFYCLKNYLFIWGCLVIAKEQQVQINEDIRDKEVRVIGSNGDQLGIMSSSEALNRAAEANLDLVKIAPQATPPVCKIMDYGKYRFEQQKREKEAKKKTLSYNQKFIRKKRTRKIQKNCGKFRKYFYA